MFCQTENRGPQEEPLEIFNRDKEKPVAKRVDRINFI
jgi:hypothetical protein